MKQKNKILSRFKQWILSIVSGQREQFDCYEIWRPNIPADGCKIQCKECAEKQKQSNCH